MDFRSVLTRFHSLSDNQAYKLSAANMKERVSTAWLHEEGNASPKEQQGMGRWDKGRQKPTENYNHSFISEHSSREEEAPQALHVEGATQAPAIEWTLSA